MPRPDKIAKQTPTLGHELSFVCKQIIETIAIGVEHVGGVLHDDVRGQTEDVVEVGVGQIVEIY